MDPEWDEDVECCLIGVVHELLPKRAIWRIIRVPREHDQEDHVQENDVVDPDQADPQRNQRRHADELRELMATHPRGDRAYLAQGKARDMLWPLLEGFDRGSTRGVLFLDPYGLQVDWSMVRRISATKALDVFFLVSLSGLYRNAAVDKAAINTGHRDALTRFLGTEEWITAVYVHEQKDLFGDPLVTRAPGYEGMLDFTTKRLRSVFPYVGDPCLLGSANGAPLFALYFAVANTSKKALELASRVSEDILRPLR